MSAWLASRRVPAWLVWVVVPSAVVALAFLWWTVSPLFISTRVDEAFPTSAPAAAAPADTMADPTADTMADPTADTMAAPTADTMADPTADTMAAPTADTMAADTMAAPTADAMAVDTMAEPTADTMAADTMAEPTAAPAGPVALASGSFTVIDRLHGAEGTATIYALPDGQRVLRLEGFTAQNGPDLRIGLAGHPMPRSSAELHDTGAGYLELAGLKASEGSQNYELPADLDLAAYQSVVIYCRAFSVVFSTAALEM